jgi:hypothetical protein
LPVYSNVLDADGLAPPDSDVWGPLLQKYGRPHRYMSGSLKPLKVIKCGTQRLMVNTRSLYKIKSINIIKR